MRRIVKTKAPKSLRDWVAATKQAVNNSYSDLPASVMQDLKKQLLEEQFFLCAYTGLQIEAATSHIEHLRPQNDCRTDKKRDDVNYKNVVACFPADGGDTSHGFGAPIKAGWWKTPALFVSPLAVQCEQLFEFSWSGQVKPKNAHLAATKTIELLGLDCVGLNSLRKASIQSFFGFDGRSSAMTKAQAKKLLEKIEQPKDGQLRPFCFVLKQLLERHVA
jgi:uncharacterized protein (TIGR02646 family)